MNQQRRKAIRDLQMEALVLNVEAARDTVLGLFEVPEGAPSWSETVTEPALVRSLVEALRAASEAGDIEAAQGEIQGLGDEEQECFDNLPEGLQQAERGQAMEEAASALSAAADGLAEAASTLEGLNTVADSLEALVDDEDEAFVFASADAEAVFREALAGLLEEATSALDDALNCMESARDDADNAVNG